MSAANRPDVVEADVDLVLERAFLHRPGFATKFAIAAGYPADPDRVAVQRQRRHDGSSGTIDLVVTYLSGSRPVLQILVEDKVDAAFTPRQPERYGMSRDARIRAGVADRVATVLACPGIYAGASRHAGGFDAVVTFEEMALWLVGPDRDLLEAAVAKARTPYEALDVPEVSGFFAGLRLLAAREHPGLVVKPNPNVDGARPEASRTVYFDVGRTLASHPGLPTVRFSLQCWDSGAPSASAKVMLAGWAAHAGIIRARAGKALEGTGLYVRTAGGSLAIVADTPRLDNRRPVEEQADAVRAALSSASRLAGWWNRSGAELAELARLVR